MNTNQEEQTPPPLTDDDVVKIMGKLSHLSAKDLNEICDGYTNHIKNLINLGKRKLNPKTDEDELAEIAHLMRLLNMLPKEEIFIRSKDKIWFARKHILQKNIDWFLNRDYSKNIKKDGKQRMIETLIRIIRGQWVSLSEEEKEIYWDKGLEILGLVARFKKLANEP